MNSILPPASNFFFACLTFAVYLEFLVKQRKDIRSCCNQLKSILQSNQVIEFYECNHQKTQLKSFSVRAILQWFLSHIQKLQEQSKSQELLDFIKTFPIKVEEINNDEVRLVQSTKEKFVNAEKKKTKAMVQQITKEMKERREDQLDVFIFYLVWSLVLPNVL